jgi:anti-sigma regulatory factor (Ser/Thr protein kinase)
VATSHHTFDLRTSETRKATVLSFQQDAFRLPAVPASVGEARHWLDERLCAWGVRGDVHADALLVLSELVTNALIHTRSTEIVSQAWATSERLYLAVADQGRVSTEPHVCDAGTDAASGRGLLLVQAMTDQWGVLPAADGRVVWAAFPIALTYLV